MAQPPKAPQPNDRYRLFTSETGLRALRRKGGLHAARYWRTNGYINLVQARFAHWVLRRRHWPEPCLTEFMADLSDIADSPETTTRRRRKRK